MNLLPGFQLAVAPHFHLPVAWGELLALGAGAEQGPAARGPWQPPTEAELALLVRDPSLAAAREELGDCLCLFRLPGHLRSAFWSMLEREGEGLAGFAEFASAVQQFLSFKQLPPPSETPFELMLCQPGLPAVDLGARPWGVVNLGEEAASLVYVNLPEAESARLPSDYPRVRLSLPPGVGCRFPSAGLPAAGCTLERQGPDVLLVVRQAG